MKNRLYYLLVVACCGVLTGCSSGSVDEPDMPDNPDTPGDEQTWTKIDRVQVSAEDVQSGMASTRTSFTLDPDKLNFSWSAGDEIGIFPRTYTNSSQVKMTLSSGSGEKNAVFTGNGWAMRSDVQYMAYYPYREGVESSSAINLTFDGQHQNGNGSLAHLGQYDYMVAEPTSPVNEALNLSFKHINAVAQINLTLPVAVSVDKLTLTCGSNVLWKTAWLEFYSLDEGEGASYLYEPETTDYRLSMTLENIETTAANQVVTLYMTLPPVDLSGCMLLVDLHGTNGRSYQGALSSRKLESGKAYRFDATLVDATMETSDVDTPDFTESEI